MQTCTMLPTSQVAAFDHEALVPKLQATPMPHWQGAGPFCCGIIPNVVSTPASPTTHAGIPSWPLHLMLSLSTLAPNHTPHQGYGSFSSDSPCSSHTRHESHCICSFSVYKGGVLLLPFDTLCFIHTSVGFDPILCQRSCTRAVV